MKRFTLRLAIALFTFIIGVFSTALQAVHPFRSTENIPVSVPMVAVLKIKSNHPEGWKKIDVRDKFSFYLPPDMKTVNALGCPFGVRENFDNQSLGVSYDYIPKELSGEYGYQGRVSCEVMEAKLRDQTIYRISEVEIGGKRARQIFNQWKSKQNYITLCFPNLGDGAILRFGVGLEDERAMDIAKQIFDSIEFR